MIGPLPTLFVGVGPCAERTLAEFSGLARRLTVPVQGPFGLVLVDSYCEDLFKCDWPWVSDFKIPDALGAARPVRVRRVAMTTSS